MDPESTRVENESEMEEEVRETWREFESERVEALSQATSMNAQERATQSVTIFLILLCLPMTFHYF